jgi:hypothetical protein
MKASFKDPRHYAFLLWAGSFVLFSFALVCFLLLLVSYEFFTLLMIAECCNQYVTCPSSLRLGEGLNQVPFYQTFSSLMFQGLIIVNRYCLTGSVSTCSCVSYV